MMTSRWTRLKPHKIQSQFFRTDKRFSIASAGRRSGKTELAKRRLVIKAIKFSERRGRFIAGAPTRPQAKRIFWEDLKALVPKWALADKPKAIKESSLTIELFNGSIIEVMGMERPERAEGEPIDFIILDEYGNMKPDVWTRHIRPALSTPGRPGEAIFIGVPEGRNHYYDLVEDAKDKEDWIALTWPTADINPEEAEAAKKDMDLLTWQQEYEGAFVSFEGRCYYAFGDWNIGQPNYNPNLPLIFCFDFNRCPGVAAVLQEQGDLTCIIDEIFITTNSNTEIVCDRLMSRWHKHKGEILLYGDASGGAKTSQAIDGSDWDIIERKIPQGISMYARANPKIRQRVNAVNSRLKSATGQVSLIVHENCKNIIKDFEGVICDDFGDPAKESGSMLTHISDAIGYYIYEEFPLEGNGLNRSAA